ncbi:MAG: hypothetical protein AMS21_04380 [Gemmatimonas sp. SG8_38_2]|nr:MAG: hypothetical protein AMS21_04380 [Gemmatimonas sp. SG8_38_2]
MATFVVAVLAGCGDDEPSGPGDFPDVRGNWTGQYSVVDCDWLSGTDPFFCEDLFFVGRSLILEVDLAQSNSNVNGQAFQGLIQGPVTGTVDMSGLVRLSGELGTNNDATTTIEDWETLLVGDSLVGPWVFLVVDNTAAGFGSARIDADLTLVGPSVLDFFGCPVEKWLEQTDSLAGVLEPGDCMLDDERYWDLYAVDVGPGDSIEFLMGAQSVSPGLLIADVDDVLLGCSSPEATVDCDQNPSDSVAAVALEATIPETWLIIASAFEARDTGSYWLTLRKLGGAGATSAVPLRRVPAGVRGPALDANGPSWSTSEGYEEYLAWKFAAPRNRVGRSRR